MSTKEHTFTMDLTPDGIQSLVLLDGVDICSLLYGVEIKSGVNQPTTVTLIPALGQRASLIARLPEAQIIIAEET